LSIGNLVHSDKEFLLKGLLRRKEIQDIFIQEERVKRKKVQSSKVKDKENRQ